MSNILEFKSGLEARSALAIRRDTAPHMAAGGEVVIFPGIRYERQSTLMASHRDCDVPPEGAGSVACGKKRSRRPRKR